MSVCLNKMSVCLSVSIKCLSVCLSVCVCVCVCACVSDRYVFFRSDFEEVCSDLLQRVSAPCKAALQASGLSKSNIAAVEIVGGSSRIPGVKQILLEVFGQEVSTTLNQDEAVARGCALQVRRQTSSVIDYLGGIAWVLSQEK